MADALAGGESQGGAMEASGCPGRHLEAEEGLYLPEPDRASLHGSEGLLNVHSTWFEENFLAESEEKASFLKLWTWLWMIFD